MWKRVNVHAFKCCICVCSCGVARREGKREELVYNTIAVAYILDVWANSACNYINISSAVS